MMLEIIKYNFALYLIAPILINTYRCEASLFTGDYTIFSCEGTTHGEPLAMAMHIQLELYH